jgi:hypothetical protein
VENLRIRVLRKIFGPKRKALTEYWRKFHNEELHDLCSSPTIVGVNKSRRMRWAGHLAFMTGKLCVCSVLFGKP